MEWDFQEIVAATVASSIGRFLLLLTAIWIGCGISMYSMLSWARDSSDLLMMFWMVVVSPILLFSSWAVLNVPFLIFYIVRFLREEGDGYWLYGLVVAVESIACLLGYGSHFVEVGPRLVACLVLWLCLLGLVEFGIWKLRNHGIQKLASEIERVREENASAQAEKMAAERERMSLEKVR